MIKLLFRWWRVIRGICHTNRYFAKIDSETKAALAEWDKQLATSDPVKVTVSRTVTLSETTTQEFVRGRYVWKHCGGVLESWKILDTATDFYVAEVRRTIDGAFSCGSGNYATLAAAQKIAERYWLGIGLDAELQKERNAG